MSKLRLQIKPIKGRFQNLFKTGLAFFVALGVTLSISIPGAQAEFFPNMESQQIPTWLKVYAGLKPVKKPYADFFSLIQPGYFEPENGNGMFKTYRLRTGLRGAVNSTVSYWVLFELASNPANNAVGGATRLLDGTITLSFKPVRLQFGQTVIPFSFDETANAFNPWINYSDVSKRLYLSNHKGDVEMTNAAREMGIMAWQEFKLADKVTWLYFIGAFNGTGMRQNDNNKAKDIIANTQFNYGPLKLAASFWNGASVQGEDGRSFDKEKYEFRAVYGSHLPWQNKDKIWAMFEYQGGVEDHPGDVKLKMGGYQTALGYRPTYNTLLTYRYSTYTEDAGTGKDLNIDMSSIIFQYFVANAKPTQLRLMFEYDIRDNNMNPKDENIFWFRLSGVFIHSIFGAGEKK